MRKHEVTITSIIEQQVWKGGRGDTEMVCLTQTSGEICEAGLAEGTLPP